MNEKYEARLLDEIDELRKDYTAACNSVDRCMAALSVIRSIVHDDPLDSAEHKLSRIAAVLAGPSCSGDQPDLFTK